MSKLKLMQYWGGAAPPAGLSERMKFCKTNNPELIQKAERDFKPLIKKHWDRFTHLTSEFV